MKLMKLETLVLLSLIAIVAMLSATAHAQTFSVIHTFTGTGGDGAYPQSGVTLKGSALFGTTQDGGEGGVGGPGTVYQMTHTESGWNYAPIFLFPRNMSGGAGPVARVVFGPDGHLYGTTNYGGAYQGGGVVFYLTPPVSICKTVFCPWKENVIWNFGNGTDGANPGGGDLVWDDQGNIYDTTSAGGTYSSGTFYKMQKVGSVWTEEVRLAFNNTDYESCPAGSPWGGVTYVNGGFYGTGTTGPHGAWAWEVDQFNNLGCLQSFSPGLQAGLTADGSGNLYGASSSGGTNNGGTVFELVNSPFGYTFNVLYNLSGPAGQCGPQANLTLDAAGNLYGTTVCDGANHFGNVFKLTRVGNTWVYTSLYEFTGGSDGEYPISNVSIDSDGTLYGTASSRGANNLGVVWMIKP